MEPIRTKSARYEFKAARDENGVPHVDAPTWREALYAWGYMHAIDRPTQVYFARAVASGQAAECIANKPELLEMDMFLRRAGLYRDLPREIKSLPESTTHAARLLLPGRERRLLDAGRTLPMWVTGFQPRPWDPYSVLLDRQPAELRRPDDRRAGERTAAARADSARRRRRAASRVVPSLSGRHRFRTAPRNSHRQAALRRSARAARRLAASGRQQCLGREPCAAPRATRCWRPIRIWKSIACRRSGTKSRSTGATASTRWARRCPAPRSWPSAARRGWPGASPTCTPTPATFSSKIAAPAARPAGNIAAATSGSISSIGRKSSNAAARRPTITGRVRKRARHAQSRRPAERRAGQVSLGHLDRRPVGRRPRDRHLARRDRQPEHGRRDGCRAALPASVAGVGLRRPRRPHRHAGQRLAPAARRRQLGHRADRRLGSRRIIGRAACGPICCRASTIRPSASSPAPTKNSTAATDRRSTPTALPDYRKRRIVERLDRIAARPRSTTCRRCNTTC